MKYAKITNGKVIVYSTLPKIFENIINFTKASIEVVNSKGFFELVIPVITEHQRLIPLAFEDFYEPQNSFIQRVEAFTQAEIDAHEETKIDNAISIDLDQHEADGVEYFRKVRNFIKRHHNDGEITDAQLRGIKQILQPALLPLKDGNWDIAQDNINAITPPTNAKMLFIYDKVKTKIDEYILTM